MHAIPRASGIGRSRSGKSVFSLPRCRRPRDVPPFPPRRSSDLWGAPPRADLGGGGPYASSTRSPLLITIGPAIVISNRSEEHTSELQSRLHLVSRLRLEKKNVRAQHSKDLQG